MASLSPWKAAFGAEQGRIQPLGWSAPEGSYVFVLGSDLPDRTAWFAVGDRITAQQSCTVPVLATLLRARLRIRGASAMPAGVEWVVSLLIDGVTLWSQPLTIGKQRDRADVGVNVAHLAGGDHVFAFRLELSFLGGPGAPFYDVELPAVYVDALLFDEDTTRPALLNRDPEPADTGVLVDAKIRLDLTDIGATGVDLTATTITVDGVNAFVNGVFQPGFTGPSSSLFAPQADTRRIVLDPVLPLKHTSTVQIGVVSAVIGGSATLNTSYSFQTEDLTAPALLTATGTAQRKIRLVFSEAVLRGDGTAPGDALNPANYVITIIPPATGFQIAVTLVVVSVLPVTGAEVDLITDIEQTPGASYSVTVNDVEDTNGNAAWTPTNVAPFSGFQPYVPPDRDREILWTLPNMNLEEDETEDLAKFVACCEELFNLILVDIDAFPDIVDPDTAPERYVDLMLRDLGNPFATFSASLSLIDKQQLAQLLVPIYRSKGVDPGIVDAIRLLLGIEVTITIPAISMPGLGQWTLGGTWVLGSSDIGTRLTFHVNVPRVLTDLERVKMNALIAYMKREATHHRIIEPAAPPPVPAHMVLGLSQLGKNWTMH